MSEGIAVAAQPSEVDPGVVAPLLVALVLPGMEPIEIGVSQRALDKVLAHFNPSEDVRVTIAKGLHAALIQQMMDHIDIEMSTEFDSDDIAANQRQVDASEARMDLAARAVDSLEVSQMLAVKSFFAKA